LFRFFSAAILSNELLERCAFWIQGATFSGW